MEPDQWIYKHSLKYVIEFRYVEKGVNLVISKGFLRGHFHFKVFNFFFKYI